MSHDIYMKLGPVTKTYNRNTATSRKIEDDVMSKNCDIIVFFQFITELQPTGSRILEA